MRNGQYVGLRDKTGIMVHEGDIVEWIDSDGRTRKDVVKYHKGKGRFFICNANYKINEYGDIKVLGSIYNHPELLQVD